MNSSTSHHKAKIPLRPAPPIPSPSIGKNTDDHDYSLETQANSPSSTPSTQTENENKAKRNPPNLVNDSVASINSVNSHLSSSKLPHQSEIRSTNGRGQDITAVVLNHGSNTRPSLDIYHNHKESPEHVLRRVKTNLTHVHHEPIVPRRSGSESVNSTDTVSNHRLHPNATSAMISNPATARVRRNWIQYLINNISGISRASKLLLFINSIVLLVQLISGISILLAQREAVCDRPLALYLLIYLLRSSFSYPVSAIEHILPRHRQRHLSPYVNKMLNRTKLILDVFGIFWFFIGNYWIFSSKTCVNTSTPLYYMSLATIILGYFILMIPILITFSVIFCLPCVLMVMRIVQGESSNTTAKYGATDEIIKQFPIVQFRLKSDLYDPDLKLSNSISTSSCQMPEQSQLHQHNQKLSSTRHAHTKTKDSSEFAEIELDDLSVAAPSAEKNVNSSLNASNTNLTSITNVSGYVSKPQRRSSYRMERRSDDALNSNFSVDQFTFSNPAQSSPTIIKNEAPIDVSDPPVIRTSLKNENRIRSLGRLKSNKNNTYHRNSSKSLTLPRPGESSSSIQASGQKTSQVLTHSPASLKIEIGYCNSTASHLAKRSINVNSQFPKQSSYSSSNVLNSTQDNENKVLSDLDHETSTSSCNITTSEEEMLFSSLLSPFPSNTKNLVSNAVKLIESKNTLLSNSTNNMNEKSKLLQKYSKHTSSQITFPNNSNDIENHIENQNSSLNQQSHHPNENKPKLPPRPIQSDNKKNESHPSQSLQTISSTDVVVLEMMHSKQSPIHSSNSVILERTSETLKCSDPQIDNLQPPSITPSPISMALGLTNNQFQDNNEKPTNITSKSASNPNTKPATTSPMSITPELEQEDAHCVICLNTYDDGEKLRKLHCGHHFHIKCVDEWLRLNKTCPLCVRDVYSMV